MGQRDNFKGLFRPMSIRTRRLGFHALVISGYSFLTIVLTYPLVLHLSTHIPGHYPDPGFGDPWVNMWGLGFIHRMVMESEHWSLFTDSIFYPRGVDLTFPLVFGFGLPLVVSIPFVHFLGIILTYNLFIIGSFILSSYATFRLVKYLTGDSYSAWISGMIFGFSPYFLVRSLTHLNLLANGIWIPLYILFFIKSMRDGRTANMILASFIFSLTVVSNFYYAFFLGIFTILYVLFYLRFTMVTTEKELLLKRLFFIACVISLFLLPLAWLIFTQDRSDVTIDVPKTEFLKYSADLLAFFIPSILHSLWGNLVIPIYTHFTGNAVEQTVYLGYMVLVLSLIGVLRASHQETFFWVLSALVFFVLALGPFLHINGKDHFLDFYGTPVRVPLPYLLLFFIPFMNTLRGASRSGIMVMLALAVLAGYGARHLLRQLEERSGARLLLLVFIIAIIGLEFLIIPFPLVDARIPKVYQKIATEREKGGTVLDVPLHRVLSKYEYYQTTHRKRLLLGQAPRISLSLVINYADSVPLIKFFKNPELIQDYEENPVEERDILRFIEFFDLSYVVIHKHLLGSEMFDQFERFGSFPRGSTRLEASEMFEQLMHFLLSHFPIERVEEEGDLVLLKLAPPAPAEGLAGARAGYVLDFGAAAPPVYLAEGWWPPEQAGEVGYAWSEATASQLWVRLPEPEEFVMELRLLASSERPPQGVTVYANGQALGEVALKAQGWHRYTVRVPKRAVVAGLNQFRFVYRYAAAPPEVAPGEGESRELGVAFDLIWLRQK
jgi:hypothetical protein